MSQITEHDYGIGEIQKKLSQYPDVININVSYDKGDPVDLIFSVKIGQDIVNFSLPSNWQKVWSVLKDTKGAVKTEDQARRTAWRNVKDWVHLQMALIEVD